MGTLQMKKLVGICCFPRVGFREQFQGTEPERRGIRERGFV